MGFDSLTRCGRSTYSARCLLSSVMVVAEKLIQSLEKKVADLIGLSNALNRENGQLKRRTAELQRERRELLERQRQAGEFIDSSIERLRKIEGGV